MATGLRTNNIRKLRNAHFDVCVVGAGINGAVSAAALATQGVRVALIDKGDFGGGTSSQSSNLAWGGIKYLESREFGLVAKLCKSRNDLAASYPSTVREIRFLTTIERGFRFHPVFVFLGTVLYWIMGRFATRPPRFLSRAELRRCEPLIDVSDARAGIEYSDCYLHDNDARFVFGFVRRAINNGAVVANYVGATAARRDEDGWRLTCRDSTGGASLEFTADVLINACGPEVDRFNKIASIETAHSHAFSKGIHLIVDLELRERRVLTFFASDGRLFFVMPMGPKTCIGTTDTRVEDSRVRVSEADRDFVLANANERLKLAQPLTQADIIAERCGVRPLAVDGEQAASDWISMSRKHAIEVDASRAQVSIFGGKITDCINVGDEVVDLVKSLGVDTGENHRTWYGEPDDRACDEFFHQAKLMSLDKLTNPTSSEPLSIRFWRRYGNEAFEMLERIRENPANAERMIEQAEYLRCEIEHTARRELVVTLDDFLRRRSKISQVVRREDLLQSSGLIEACRVLFGKDAEARLQEYRDAELGEFRR